MQQMVMVGLVKAANMPVLDAFVPQFARLQIFCSAVLVMMAELGDQELAATAQTIFLLEMLDTATRIGTRYVSMLCMRHVSHTCHTM